MVKKLHSSGANGALLDATGRLDADALLALLVAAHKPLRLDGILRVARVHRREKGHIEALLDRLTKAEKLVRMHGGAWLPATMVHTVVGRYAVQRSGVGFVTPVLEAAHGKPTKAVQDIFIHPSQAGEAWHGDVVRVAVTPAQGSRPGKNPEGRILEVMERSTDDVVVRVLHPVGKGLLCKAADPRLLVQFQVDVSALAVRPKAGELLAVQPQQRHASDLWSAVAVTSFGCEDDVAVQERLVKLNHKVPDAFPPKALQEAAAFAPNPSPADYEGREDLRHLPFVTIDGSSARDFDDAVHVERRGTGWVLRVAIADVSHYVRPASALDKEAQERANSWYFPASVEPMLPEALSNGLCSLNPHVDRLVMLAEMSIAASGQVGTCRFAAGVLRSAARLTYEQVQQAVVDKDPAAQAALQEGAVNATLALADSATAPVLPMLVEALALATVLARVRSERGSLDFELPEPEYVFDAHGVIVNITKRERLFSHRLIEEFMIAANEAVARFLEDKQPFLYRVHPEPEAERLEGLFRTLASTSLAAGMPAKPDASHLQALLRQAKGDPQEFLVGRLTLRTMPQARYQPENEGHFGLASKEYCHFTSPIRRYADMVVHRALKHALGHGLEKDAGPIPTAHKLFILADHLNRRERAAMEAEREMARRLGVLVLRDRVGESFSGTIAGVSDFGLFVELDAMPVEGMIRVADLGDDYYEYDPERQELTGLHTAARFMLGQRVKVVLLDVNPGRLEITLGLQEGPEGWTRGKGRRTDRTLRPAAEGRGSGDRTSDKPSGKGRGKTSGKGGRPTAPGTGPAKGRGGRGGAAGKPAGKSSGGKAGGRPAAGKASTGKSGGARGGRGRS